MFFYILHTSFTVYCLICCTVANFLSGKSQTRSKKVSFPKDIKKMELNHKNKRTGTKFAWDISPILGTVPKNTGWMDMLVWAILLPWRKEGAGIFSVPSYMVSPCKTTTSVSAYKVTELWSAYRIHIASEISSPKRHKILMNSQLILLWQHTCIY